MFARLFENLTGRRSVNQSRLYAGRLSALPEFRAIVASTGNNPELPSKSGSVVFLAGRVSHVLDDVSELREAGYEVQIGMEGDLSGVIFVVDPGSFASRDALGRMLTLIRSITSDARVIIRTSAATEAACRLTAERHGVIRAPDGTMEDVADILRGEVLFVSLHGCAPPDAKSPALPVVS